MRNEEVLLWSSSMQKSVAPLTDFCIEHCGGKRCKEAQLEYKKSVRGTKAMAAKDRLSVIMTSNAVGTQAPLTGIRR